MAVTIAAARITAYFLKHWRGDFGLGHSFWINLVLFAGAAYAIAVGLTAATGLLEGPLPVSAARRSAQIGASIGLHLGAILYVVLLLWQITGVWRAAERHITVTREKLWARAAQASLPVFLAGLGFSLA